MTSTPSQPRATARTIADALREQIRSGALPPGSVLPTGRELAATFGVTSKTANAGTDLLKLEGLIVGEQGGRRRVRSTRRITWDLTRFERGNRRDTHAADDWATAIKAAGRDPRETVTAHRGIASTEVADWLRIPPGSEIVYRERIRSVDGEPFQLSRSSFPAHIAVGTVAEQAGEISFPGGLMAHIGHPQLSIRDEISTRMPTPEETERLSLPMGTPVLQHVRIGYGSEFPVRVMVTIAPGDRHLLVYEMDV